jgi:translation initiation factor 6
MHVLKTDFNGNPNVGLYGFATDSYCLLSTDVDKRTVAKVEKALKVPVHQLNICGTSLVGVFLVGNSNCLLVPSIAFDSELKKLDHFKIKYKVLKSDHTALGNNILCNDFGCLVSSDFSVDEKKHIESALGVPVHSGKIADLDTVGSGGVLSSKGGMLHRDASNQEVLFIESLLKVKCNTGTVNMANPFVRSGVIANSHGFVIGRSSGSPELMHIDEVLGFLDNK